MPLSSKHPHSLLLYYCNDTNANLLITTSKFVDITQRVVKNRDTKLLVLDDKICQDATEKGPLTDNDLRVGLSTEFYNKANAMILYTSGTTGNPKGEVKEGILVLSLVGIFLLLSIRFLLIGTFYSHIDFSLILRLRFRYAAFKF